MERKRLSHENFDCFDKSTNLSSSAKSIREKRKGFENQNNKQFDYKNLALIGSIFVALAGTGTFASLLSKVENNFSPEVNIEYNNEKELKNQKPNYTIEQIPLPYNLPNTNKDFLRYKPETGKVMQVKKRGSDKQYSVFLYEANGSVGKYIDKNGKEFIIDKLNGQFIISNEQKMGHRNSSIFVTPAKETTIIPAPDANLEIAINKLAQQGYETEAILSTGVIRDATSEEISEFKKGQNPFVAESKLRKGKFYTAAGEVFVRNINGTASYTKNLENNRPMRKTGYYTSKKMELFF